VARSLEDKHYFCEAKSRLALKNADALLKDVLKAVDTSGDGRIQYNGENTSRGLETFRCRKLPERCLVAI
jgi:hypothetical protein